jgi:hypothetical protein
MVLHPMGEEDQRWGMESEWQEGGQEAVRLGAGRAAGSSDRRRRHMQGPFAASLGRQRWLRGGVQEGVQPELHVVHHDGEGHGHSGGRHRLPPGGAKDSQVYRHRGHIGQPAFEGEVPGLQANCGGEGLAPQAGAGQDSGGPAQVAGQAISL